MSAKELVMKSSIVSMTPKWAAELLMKNHSNRPIRKAFVEYLASEMRLGRWKNNGEIIAVDVEGTLRNGQHRLSAVVLSGCTVSMNLVINVAMEDADQYDTGIGRSISDVTTITPRASSVITYMVTTFAVRASPSGSRVSPVDATLIWDSEIGTEIRMLFEQSPKREMFFGSPAMIMAAVFTVLADQRSRKYVHDVYHGLIYTSSEKELPRIAQALVARVSHERMHSVRHPMRWLIAQGMVIFDESKKDNRIIVVRDDFVESCLKSPKARVNAILDAGKQVG